MKLAMAQMAMSTDMAENLKNSLRFCEEAKGSDLLFFMDFAGESIVVHPSGDVICKADDKERLVCCEIDLAESDAWRAKKPYIPTRRPECYL